MSSASARATALRKPPPLTPFTERRRAFAYPWRYHPCALDRRQGVKQIEHEAKRKEEETDNLAVKRRKEEEILGPAIGTHNHAFSFIFQIFYL
ncbi:hypothetical protein SESBI_02148 [Sesbania bispinosa]|nr:hypothetical protein SESBI_02148 [Sesbania bispinosa]